MSESMPHKSSFSSGGINAMSWAGQDGIRHHRVVFEIRGVMVLPIDAAGEFVGQLGEAIRQTSESA